MLWCASYLSNRAQVLKISGKLSPAAPVSMEVPQRSILGPSLFMLFVGDLFHSISWNRYQNPFLLLHADDAENISAALTVISRALTIFL